ncbi:hypothetical protein VNO80_02624 [Phaseolus coccineus]|uniref:Uncharacterized protein n=1 Tax=Phaseolus coccineus TaxID=3886 RepID=A0AAN9NUK5_PHACN
MQRWRSRLGSISISRKGATTSSLDDHLSPPLSAIVLFAYVCLCKLQRTQHLGHSEPHVSLCFLFHTPNEGDS